MNRTHLPSHDTLIRRPRLDTLLKRGLRYPLVTVIAGPGYGKTLAVAEYMKQIQQRLIWLPLLSLDNDSARFWRSLKAAFRQELPGTAQSLNGMDFPGSVGEFDEFLRIFARELYHTPGAVLVLDNYECIENQRIERFVATLIEAGLEGLCIVLISSKKLNFGALINDGNHFRISMDDLRFTTDEVKRLFAMNDFRLTAQEQMKITQETEGWPLVLQLICSRLSPSAGLEMGEKPYLQMLAELFELNYFNGYPPPIRELLIKLSLFSSFSIELAKKLWKHDIEMVVRELSMNIFISYDYSTHTYSFQSMYRSFLADKKPLLPDKEAAAVYKTGGDWFLHNNRIHQALDCYWNCSDYGGFLEAVAKLPWTRANTDSSRATFNRLCKIPSSYSEENPRVDFFKGFLQLNNQDVLAAEETLYSLLTRLEAQPDSDGLRMIKGDIHTALADIALLRNNTAALEHIKEAAALLPNGCSIHAEGLLLVENNPAFFLPDNAPGRLEEMMRFMHEFSYYGDRVYNGCGYGSDHLFSAEGAFYAGKMEEALKYSIMAVNKAQVKKQHDIICNAIWLRLRIALYRGNHEKSTELFQEAINYVGDNRLTGMHTLVNCMKTWYFLQLGEPEKVPMWMARYEKMSSKLPLDQGRTQIAYAYYLIAKEDYLNAYRVLLQLDDIFEQKGLWSIRLLYRILKAYVFLKTGYKNSCLQEFTAAYEMTHTNNITVPFIELGKITVKLIDTALSELPERFDVDWLNCLQMNCMAYSKRLAAMQKLRRVSPKPAMTTGIPLTSREMEVLRALANGLTREEICALLHISIHGVKKHITSIYTKLGAINRAEAIHISMINGLLRAEAT